MKKVYIFIVMAMVMGTFCLFTSCVNIITGNGNVVTSEKPVSSFEKISIMSSADVRYHASEEYRVVISIDESLDEYVNIFTNNNVLNISIKNGYNCLFTKFLVDVYSPVLTGVSMTGSGNFDGATACDSFSGIITGSGKITVTGIATDANITITGSGSFDGSGFYIKNAVVKITGSGDSNISVEDNLTSTIIGSGEITYRGEPTVESNVIGSGKINKIN